MKESTKEKIRDYDLEYKKKNYRVYSFRLNKEADKELIEYFDSIKDKTSFLKELINSTRTNHI